jgi:hypothetical protein
MALFNGRSFGALFNSGLAAVSVPVLALQASQVVPTVGVTPNSSITTITYVGRLFNGRLFNGGAFNGGAPGATAVPGFLFRAFQVTPVAVAFGSGGTGEGGGGGGEGSGGAAQPVYFYEWYRTTTTDDPGFTEAKSMRQTNGQIPASRVYFNSARSKRYTLTTKGSGLVSPTDAAAYEAMVLAPDEPVTITCADGVQITGYPMHIDRRVVPGTKGEELTMELLVPWAGST